LPDLDAVVEEVQSLHVGGYQRAGQWDLAQACGHMGDWMRFPIDGFPSPPLPIGLMLWVMRRTIGRKLLREILQSRSMRPGNKTMPDTIPEPGGDEASAVGRFTELVARFQAHQRPYHPSPLFGHMDRETLFQLQLIHCRHHLSFLLPKEQPGE
jgi:hypothetical protein